MENISFMRNGKEFKPTRAELERVLDDFAERLAILEKALELMAKSVWSDGTSCMKFLDTGIQVNSQVEYFYSYQVTINSAIYKNKMLKSKFADANKIIDMIIKQRR